MPDKGQEKSLAKRQVGIKDYMSRNNDFVLERDIFSNVFEKDIRRVFIYKKAERLAKAIHLIAPAFASSEPLRARLGALSVGLVDAAIEAPLRSRALLSRELLALSSILSIGRTSGLLSAMNADLIEGEAHRLLREVADYEEPMILVEDAPTLPALAREQRSARVKSNEVERRTTRSARATGEIKDIKDIAVKDRREAILAVVRQAGSIGIRGIASAIHSVSEKTIQRELQALIDGGVIERTGERRWSTYSIK